MRDALKKWFRDSETIAFARLQVATGFILSAAGLLAGLFFDPTAQAAIQQIVPAAYWPYILIGMGLLSELLRRHRDPDMH